MTPRLLLCAGTLAALSAFGQTPAVHAVKPATKTWTPPKTPWGDPDLQGQWPATANIPMQRPANLGTRAFLTEEEFQAREKQAQRQSESDSEEFAPASNANVTINPPSYWQERGAPSHQASLIVDPPNGRTPPLTPEGQAAMKALNGGKGPGQHYPTSVGTWTDFDIYSRCITRGVINSMLPTLYNFGNQIVQMPGYVVIRNEMVHETRVIPLNAGPHVGSAIRTYMGDSRGHWDGNTLVVETTNLKDQPGTNGGLFSDSVKLTEKFTRTSPNDLVYQVTVDDPKTWTKPWTISMPYKLDPHYTIYEYACHEGNYMMQDALSGAREFEKKGLSTSATPQR